MKLFLLGIAAGILLGAASLVGLFRYNALWAYDVIFWGHDAEKVDENTEEYCRDIYPVYVDRLLARAEAQQEYAEGGSRELYMGDLAVYSVDQGHVTEATNYATQLLEEAEKNPRAWFYANMWHDAHTALGRVAIRRGDVQAATEHLLTSVDVAGSPQLNSFGPHLMLADELYHAGQVTAVTDFLEHSRQFYDDDLQVLIWLRRIKEGKQPFFMASCPL